MKTKTTIQIMLLALLAWMISWIAAMILIWAFNYVAHSDDEALGQTSAQREFCRNFAIIMRSAAELRDLGQSKKQVMDVLRETARKANVDKALAKMLLDAVAATYDTNLSPDTVGIINYAVCLDTSAIGHAGPQAAAVSVT